MKDYVEALSNLVAAMHEYEAARKVWDHCIYSGAEDLSDEEWERVASRYENAMMGNLAALEAAEAVLAAQPEAQGGGEEIVGHKTFNDGHGGFRHEPLTRAEADALIAHCKSEDERRKALMPDERSAIRMMMDAHTRLTDIGWKDVIYCPKDGTVFEVIEPGSIGIFKCQYEGEWPKGTWWILGDGDMFPARPVLFRPIVAATSGEGEG